MAWKFNKKAYLCHKSMEQNHYIEALKAEVLLHFGRTLDAPTDYDLLSVAIKKSTGEVISVSTLKRLFGYKGQSTIPRPSTLSVLARYVGTTGWSDFCKRMDNHSADNAKTNLPRRKRWPIVVAAIVALLIVAVVAFVVFNSDNQEKISSSVTQPDVEQVEHVEVVEEPKVEPKPEPKPEKVGDVAKKSEAKSVQSKKEFAVQTAPKQDSVQVASLNVAVQEEPKQEESKQEEPKQEEPKQEEPKQEEPKQEEPKQEVPQEAPQQDLSQEQLRQAILRDAMQRSMAMCARVRKLYGTMPILEYNDEVDKEYFPFVFDTLRPYVAQKCKEAFDDPVTATQYSSEIFRLCQDVCVDLRREIGKEVGEARAKGLYIKR